MLFRRFKDKPSTGWNALGFFFPIIGLILYLCNKDTFPKKAAAVGKWALIGFIVSIVLEIIVSILYVIFFEAFLLAFLSAEASFVCLL